MSRYQRLYHYVTEELNDRYPNAKNIVANQPISKDIQMDFAVDLPDNMILVQVTQRRATIKDIMRLFFLREMYYDLTDLPKERPVKVILFSPIFPFRVRELAVKSGIELVTLPPDLAKETSTTTRKIRLTTPNAWKVVLHFIWNKRSNIRQASIEAGTSYSWTHTIVKHMISKGLIEKIKGTYTITDIDRLMNGISWERPLEDLTMREWTTVSTTVEGVLEDIRDADPEAKITGYVAVGEYFDYIRRFDMIHVYSTRLEKLEYHLGRSKDGVKVVVLKPDRMIGSYTAGRLPVKDLMVVHPGQLILDIAGIGYGARDMLRKLIEVGPNAP